MTGAHAALPLTLTLFLGLAGSSFLNVWRNRSARELVVRIATTMPPDDPGSISEQTATNIAAFIRQTNGLPVAAGDSDRPTPSTAPPAAQAADPDAARRAAELIVVQRSG